VSLIPFARSFFAVKGNQATVAVTKALVQMDPDGASAADLRVMEADLDRAGALISKLRKELAQEQREYQAVNTQYRELMAAAELLKTRIDAAPDDGKASLEASLSALLDRLDHMVPEVDREHHDVEATQELLTETENAYKEKAKALTEAKAELERTRHDLQHANLQEERARERAQRAAEVAGLRQSSTNGLNVALNMMKDSADEARQRAESADMKAGALKNARAASQDENVAAALQEVRGQNSPKSLSDRLAALRK